MHIVEDEQWMKEFSKTAVVEYQVPIVKESEETQANHAAESQEGSEDAGTRYHQRQGAVTGQRPV